MDKLNQNQNLMTKNARFIFYICLAFNEAGMEEFSEGDVEKVSGIIEDLYYKKQKQN